MGFVKEFINDFLSRYDTAAYVRIKHRPIAILQGCAFIVVAIYVVAVEIFWNESYLKEVKINPYVYGSASNRAGSKEPLPEGWELPLTTDIVFEDHRIRGRLNDGSSLQFYNRVRCVQMSPERNCVEWEQYGEGEVFPVWGLKEFTVEIDHGFSLGNKLISSSNMTSAKLLDHNGDEVILGDNDCMGNKCKIDLGDPEFEEEIKPYVDLSMDKITLLTLLQAAGIGFDKEEYATRLSLGIAILASFEYKHPKKLFFFSDTSKYEYTITMKKLPSASVMNAVLHPLNETHAVEIIRSCIRIVFESVNKIYKFDLMSLILSFSAGGTVLGFVTIALDFVSKNFIRGKKVVSTMVYEETDNLHLLSTEEIDELNDKIRCAHRRDKFLHNMDDPETGSYVQGLAMDYVNKP